MRSYDIAVTSLVIEAPVKWTDNLLSQHQIPDVVSARRGVARRIPHSTLVYLAVVRRLHHILGLGARDAVRCTTLLLAGGGTCDAGVHEAGPITLSIDLADIERQVDRRLQEVLESAPAPRRGRPPKRAHLPEA